MYFILFPNRTNHIYGEPGYEPRTAANGRNKIFVKVKHLTSRKTNSTQEQVGTYDQIMRFKITAGAKSENLRIIQTIFARSKCNIKYT